MSLRIADGPGVDPVESEADREPAEPIAKREPVPGCSCYICDGSPAIRSRMYLCTICGNKRCPHATDHREICTGSNAPGQPGSYYE